MKNIDLKYSGMTVNERLVVSGLIGQFDESVRLKEIKGIINVLKQVELNDDNIKAILVGLGLTI